MGFFSGLFDKEKRALGKALKALEKGRGLRQSRADPKALLAFLKGLEALDGAVATAAKDHREWSRLYGLLGIEVLAVGDPSSSGSAFTRALDLDPANVDALGGQGQLLARQGNPDEALRRFSRALQIAPDRTDLWMHQGETQQGMGNSQAAETSFRKVVSLDPSFVLGFDRLLQLRPGDINLLLSRAGALAHHGQYDEALRGYDQAIGADPRRKEAWAGKAEVFLRTGSHEGALASLDKALEIDGHDPALWRLRGDVQRAQGTLEAALSSYDTALDYARDDVPTLLRRGTLLQQLGRHEALDSTQKARARRMAEAGQSHRQIAATLGVGKGTIWRLLSSRPESPLPEDSSEPRKAAMEQTPLPAP